MREIEHEKGLCAADALGHFGQAVVRQVQRVQLLVLKQLDGNAVGHLASML